MKELTQEELKAQLKYDPETGMFVRVSAKTKGAKIGDIAGYDRPSAGGKRYTVIKICGRAYMASRLAWLYMNGRWPENIVDHKDGDGTNNKYSNLRDVTSHENCKNRRKRVDNTSGVCGVGWSVVVGKWHSYIWVDKKKKVLGYFDDFFEAVCSRKYAEFIYGYHPNHGKERPL